MTPIEKPALPKKRILSTRLNRDGDPHHVMGYTEEDMAPLLARIEELDNEVSRWKTIAVKHADYEEKADARIEELEKDAARYRWLRKNSDTGLRYSTGKGWTANYFMLRGTELDDVIDRAALSATKEPS